MSIESVLVADADAQVRAGIVTSLAADGHRLLTARTASDAQALLRARACRLVVIGALESPRSAFELLAFLCDGGCRGSDPSSALGDTQRRPGCLATADQHRPAGLATAEQHRLASPFARENGATIGGYTAVVMLGGTATEAYMRRCFEAGADDFLCRPPSGLELRLRVKALLRRSSSARRDTKLEVGPLTVDLLSRTVTLHGRVVALRPMEFELLACLAAEPEATFTRTTLLREAWPASGARSMRTVDSHASRLRLKLAASGGGAWIVAVHGSGYRLR